MKLLSCINILCIPTDYGANIRGASLAPSYILDKLHSVNLFPKYSKIPCSLNIRKMYRDLYYDVFNTIDSKQFPLVLGGDHSISIASVSAANDACKVNRKRLGVLWCDAHADFNTIKTSPTGNIHGMPVAILCGHTGNRFQIGNYLSFDQFCYFGLRDVDSLELNRLQQFKYTEIIKVDDLDDWHRNFDKIYLSLDIDSIDPSIAPGVSTPVKNGLTYEDISEIILQLKNTNKLIGMDIVEYNPLQDTNNQTQKLIIDLCEHIFE